MIDKIQDTLKQFEADLQHYRSAADLQSLRIKYLGRKEGVVTLMFEEFRNLGVEKKRQFGTDLNSLKSHIDLALLQAENRLAENSVKNFDLTIPAIQPGSGHLHPITQLQKEIQQVFYGLGFDIESGPEVESDFYNFESLNMPENHPARDMQDTFYLDLEHPKDQKGKNILLRTHISNMQVRYMQENKPPFAVILPGRVYRNEALDASHEHTYQYMEGFMVGESINFSNMAWTLDYAIKAIFGESVKTKLLPSYFPFVEPGAEMAISCLVCKGRGCSVCKQTGWVEILGCGMIHQRVFEYAGYKRDQCQGFAFGFGLARLALMRYQIPDIRMFAENDIRFLRQF
jgi:phenylalanyl-tRNA synthetase alpha chain